MSQFEQAQKVWGDLLDNEQLHDIAKLTQFSHMFNATANGVNNDE